MGLTRKYLLIGLSNAVGGSLIQQVFQLDNNDKNVLSSLLKCQSKPCINYLNSPVLILVSVSFINETKEQS